MAGDPQVIEHRRTRERHGRGHARIGVNLTAMIDVVFLLLVYFMVATEFKLGEEIYRMDLPHQAPSARSDPFQLDDEPLRIQVASIGPLSNAYRLRLEGAIEQPSTFEALFEYLDARQIRPNAVGALFEADHPIIIEPTGATRWAHAMNAFNAAARARYTNIRFARAN